MKYAFITKAEALLHERFHLGSFMGNENETYIIDPEFAFFGPIRIRHRKGYGKFLYGLYFSRISSKKIGDKFNRV